MNSLVLPMFRVSDYGLVCYAALVRDRLAINGGKPVLPKPWQWQPLGPSSIGDEEVRAVENVLRSTEVFRFRLKPNRSEVARLEAIYRERTGAKFALALGCGGTGALIASLVGLGVGPGDEVIIPAYTYIATASAVIVVGAVPIIAEIDESLTLDPTDVECKITRYTCAVIPVHMRGLPCQMNALLRVARRHKLKVLEDVAQANGGTYRGRALGTLGDIGAFSLQYYKTITAGEGGLILTNNRQMYERAAIWHDSALHYWLPKKSKTRAFAGENYRMSEIAGAVGRVQAQKMPRIVAKLRRLRKTFLSNLSPLRHLRLVRSGDPDGEVGYSVPFLAGDAKSAQKLAAAIKTEGVRCGTVHDGTIPDRHIYQYWEYVMNQWSRNDDARPWKDPAYRGNAKYSPDMCPRTMNILMRTVVVDFNQHVSERQARLAAKAVTKVDEMIRL